MICVKVFFSDPVISLTCVGLVYEICTTGAGFSHQVLTL